jgi:hypothetical protein
MKAWIDSILLILNANNIKPTCEIVLYANNLFILNCVKPTTVPIIKESSELTNKLLVQLNWKLNKELLV